MSANFDGLDTGDILEIKYRVWRPSGAGEDVMERWVSAAIIANEHGTWPLARLADGQVTEIRPFMTWRRVFTAKRRGVAA
ncbi:hypothetical protein [Hyphomicrobium sp. LHD-15]|uniref:hypothetical protein n=1 Tax=Hyphomicrobium sp. LHD-15 TaxID=3072142 RepID=UPI00280F3DF1|nr:hypothetical protein [Hyphomicrobium sp. LHD-15]MDQ8700430.1 hypothetical protein [Hyphomicrobium sp. LHD-15]